MLMAQFLSLNLLNQMNFYNWKIDMFNDLIIFLESIIAIIVMIFILMSFYNLFWNKLFFHWMVLELLWTILPILILFLLGFPSLYMLYLSEIYSFYSTLSLKITGHQWYWSYNFPEFNLFLESYPKVISELIRGGESDVLMLPFKCKIRLLILSQDVIHSWAMPSLGFKLDASPGRLNFFMIITQVPGKHFGQCSELCGNYHSWMPISLEFSSMSLFFEWVKFNK